jgi:anti-anti-sigma factor
MRYDLNNPHLDIDPVYDDVVITFKDERMVTEDLLDRIGNDILKLAEQAPPEKWIILDFKNVKFMSSAFLGFLVKVQTTVTQCRGRLKLRNLSPDLFKVFKITQLHKIFTIDTAL